MSLPEEIFAAYDMWPDPDITWVWADVDGLRKRGVYDVKGELFYIESHPSLYGDPLIVPTTVKELLNKPWIPEECKVAVVEYVQPCGAV